MRHAHSLAVLVTCAVASCGPEGSGTSVRIALAYDDALGLDTAEVTVTERTESAPIAHELLLLIPDELAGSEQPVEVWGRKEGKQAAYGTTTVVPALGKTVAAALALAVCAPGCDGDNLRTCSGAVTKCATSCSEDGDAHCVALKPSNGIDPAAADALQGTTTIAANSTIDTDTGAISGGITRAAGTGVIAGIAYLQAPAFGNGGAPLGIFVFHGLAVEAAATVRFTGARAAVLLVGSDARIFGVLDLTAGRGARTVPGPGGGAGGTQASAAGGCGPGFPGGRSGTTDGGGGGGGGGGEMAGTGGPGGGAIPGVLGLGGPMCLPATLEPLQGGSGGGRGSPGGTATAPSGGGGGGALQITAVKSLEITGTINAGGAGADGGPASAGDAGSGAGGGAGGGVLLESPIVIVGSTAIVAANGGSGGGGGGGIAGLAGLPGENAAAASTPVQGGGGQENSANGGSGGAATSPPDVGGDGISNGGGGGGAVGAIAIRGHLRVLTGTISPFPTVMDLPPAGGPGRGRANRRRPLGFADLLVDHAFRGMPWFVSVCC
jgi:hypothetical protein